MKSPRSVLTVQSTVGSLSGPFIRNGRREIQHDKDFLFFSPFFSIPSFFYGPLCLFAFLLVFFLKGCLLSFIFSAAQVHGPDKK